MSKTLRLLVSALLAFVLAFSLVACSVGTGASAGGMKAGTYTGTGKGKDGDIQVSVTVGSGGKIDKIEITAENEDEEYALPALEDLPGTIVSAQRLDVDAVSGATITSRGILAAVADALTKAGADPKALGFASEEDISKADVVTILGLPQGEAQFTGDQLRNDYEPVTTEAISINASGEEKTITATGVLLESILAKHGVSQKDYASIVTTASDGYSIGIPDSILQTRDILIAYEVDGEAQSPRTVIPSERAMYWTKFLATIELMGAEQVEVVPADEVLLLETAVSTLQDALEDYKYYDTIEKALPISALLQQYAPDKTDYVNMRSTDELNKNEKYDTFAAQYLVLTGDETPAPLYTGPTLPEGMQLKYLLSARIGTLNIVSLANAGEVAGASDVPLQTLFDIAGMKDAQSYTLEAADGQTVDLYSGDVAKGTVSPGEDGLPVVRFDNLPETPPVEGLLRITAVD